MLKSVRVAPSIFQNRQDDGFDCRFFIKLPPPSRAGGRGVGGGACDSLPGPKFDRIAISYNSVQYVVQRALRRCFWFKLWTTGKIHGRVVYVLDDGYKFCPTGKNLRQRVLPFLLNVPVNTTELEGLFSWRIQTFA